MESDRVREIRRRLTGALAPSLLEIEDRSALHAGHAGAKEQGGGHFVVTIRSAAFRGKTAIERSRMVHAALREMMPGQIHALSIRAVDEEEQRG